MEIRLFMFTVITLSHTDWSFLPSILFLLMWEVISLLVSLFYIYHIFFYIKCQLHTEDFRLHLNALPIETRFFFFHPHLGTAVQEHFANTIKSRKVTLQWIMIGITFEAQQLAKTSNRSLRPNLIHPLCLIQMDRASSLSSRQQMDRQSLNETWPESKMRWSD